MDKIDYLNEKREVEFELVFDKLALEKLNELEVLELGCGTGRQLLMLRGMFKSAEGIEIEDSNYKDSRLDGITLYNGTDIPFENEKFDCVFSSNVLEHVPDIAKMNMELARVVKDEGFAVHVMPTHIWRFWTTITSYLAIPSKIINTVFKKQGSSVKAIDSYKSKAPRSKGSALLNMLLPKKHGDRGSVLSEHYYFHSSWWRKQFEDSSWELVQVYGNGLFYTGHTLFGSSLSWRSRMVIARILGSSCYVYILRKKKLTDI